jgi:hypothetical protein
MLLNDHKMPTLGHFHKVVCECLGLWGSENTDVIFTLSATEESRRAALRSAFEAIQKTEGMYGTLDELVAVTTKIAPPEATLTKKERTVQAWVQELSRSDFSSHDEFLELGQFIEGLIRERYARYDVSQMAVSFYRSSTTYYREFLRECPSTQADTYQNFIGQTLTSLVRALVAESSEGEIWPYAIDSENPWPLANFLDRALVKCEKSRHKLYQFHEMAKDCIGTDAEIWARNFKSTPTNTKSKQTIARFSKPIKIKFSHIYTTVQPLAYLLKDLVDTRTYSNQILSAFICHNLNLQIFRDGSPTAPIFDSVYPRPGIISSQQPVTDTLDLLFEAGDHADGAAIEASMELYRQYVTALRALFVKEDHDTGLPAALDFWYGSEFDMLNDERWYKYTPTSPEWMNEWRKAMEAMSAEKPELALEFFRKALAGAKYTAGPLFIPLYVQICAFCKRHFQRLPRSGVSTETDIDKLYDLLGSQASSYSGLLGYTPAVYRDAATLLPITKLRSKNSRIIKKIDSLM